MKHFLLIIPLFFACCIDDSDVNYTYYRNDLDVKLCFWSDFLNPEEVADTSLWNESPFSSDFFKGEERYRNIIPPHTTIKKLTGSETFFQFGEGRIRRIYFFNYDSVIALPWKKIRDEYLVIKRVDMHSIKEYEDCNYTIVIP